MTGAQHRVENRIHNAAPNLVWSEPKLKNTATNAVHISARLSTYSAAKPDRVIAEIHADGTFYLQARHYPNPFVDISLSQLTTEDFV